MRTKGYANPNNERYPSLEGGSAAATYVSNSPRATTALSKRMNQLVLDFFCLVSVVLTVMIQRYNALNAHGMNRWLFL